jgi:DNA-binding transcriptional LysR family regulator
MRMSLPQIETFYWIARLGSFHAAARHLNLTQPTLSVRIRSLEAELGAPLFLRSPTRARLTQAGLAILGQAERMLALAAEMKRETSSGGAMRGLLRLGAVETVARLAVPQLLAHLAAAHEALRVELAVDIGSSLSRRLNDRELDVAIVTDPRPNDQVRAELLGTVELSWIAAGGHPLARKLVRPRDLRLERIFTHPKGSTTHDIVESWFRAAQIEPTRLGVCNSIGTMKELVAAGLGLAVVTPALFRNDIKKRAIVALKAAPPIPSRPLFLCCLRETWSDDIAELVRRTQTLLVNAGALSVG